jgi:dynein heavy chain
MADDLEIGDARVEFMAGYILKTLKIKGDKWTKMYGIEENKITILEYLEKNENSLLVFLLSSSGALAVSYNYPSVIKTKACYFAKKQKESISKDMNLKEALIYGDLSYSPLEQLSALLDEVINRENLFKNE